jgi:hypothetical protein
LAICFVADANPSTGIADAWPVTMLAPSKAAKAKTAILRLAITIPPFSRCRPRNRHRAETSHIRDVGMLKMSLANINPSSFGERIITEPVPAQPSANIRAIFA